jgi:hypothetical protein
LFAADQTSEEDFTFGAGFVLDLALSRVSADYAFTNFNRLGTVHRISLTCTY